MSNLVGKSIDRYQILEQLGEGGMATVYKAYDTRLERDVAVKIIRRNAFPLEQLDRILKRFEREAKSLAKLSHPNIVGVIDYGEYEGAPYLVLVYLPGGTLKERMMGKPMRWQEAVRMLVPIANALDYAHEQKIIHRDVKPANILLTVKGQPMLSDFGIAKILEMEDGHTLTGTGMSVGTPEYMSPEQGMGREVDARADIYSLGIIFFELIIGRKPYTADTPMAVILKHMTEPLPRPRQYVADLPEAVERVLLKALAKDPKERYSDAGALAVAMENLTSSDHTTGNEQIARAMGDAAATMDMIAANPQTLAKSNIHPEIPVRRTLAGKRKIALGLGILILGLTGIYLAVFLGTGNLVSPTGRLAAATQTLFVELATKTPVPATSTATIIPTPILGIGSTIIPTPTFGIGSTMIGEEGATLMYVPAGKFTMGSDTGANDEKPAHTVYLDAFWIDQTEVTNKQYAACVSGGGCTPPSNTGSSTHSRYYGNSEFDEFPVIYVDWDQANAYCSWAGRKLPTEAQWEKAARGTDARIYPWGNGAPNDTLLNYNSSIGDTTKVGSYETGKSFYGVYDMAGNVWEWVNDWYSETYYKNSLSSNPLGPDAGQVRVLRGGAWRYYDSSVRSIIRSKYLPSNSNGYNGFRCARSFP